MTALRLVPAACSLVGLALTVACSGSSGSADGAAASAAPSFSRDQQQALDDVERVAPALESYYRSAGYPTDVPGAIESLAGAEVKLTPGSRINGYTFDEAAQEFTLCVETFAGAWATYDTAPMALRETGPSKGCPRS